MAHSTGLHNELHRESSPYLLQHAKQPVHWRAWNDASLAQAQTLNRPILLSVGYAACHWCHVMAHESFDDPELAAMLNAHFVCIKVDREERPDIDQIYMGALQAMGEQGGWPLTMFLTPTGEPFWGGTYFPPEPRWGRPSFRTVLQSIAEAYEGSASAVQGNARQLTAVMRSMSLPPRGSFPDPERVRTAAARLLELTDPCQGGLRGAPKFPNFPVYRFLSQRAARGDRAAAKAVDCLLQHLCCGGIQDHVGGGLFRYSTDAIWLVPHFEKMLYDNAQFLEALALAHAARPRPLYRETALALAAFLQRDMDAQGCFAASLDADTQDGEGAFYVWTESEVDDALGPRSPAFKAAFDVTPQGNWEGRCILRRVQAPTDDDPSRFQADLAALARVRAMRPAPALDDKVLTDWNCLAIEALCRAGQCLSEPSWVSDAASRFAVLSARLRPADRWHHAWRAGAIAAAGLLDDVAAAGNAALALFEATGEQSYLQRATAFAREADAWFGPAADGYFMTAADIRDIPASLQLRPRSALCSAVPSGSGMMARLLARLFHLTGEPAYAARAREVINAFGARYEQPLACPTLLAAAELLEDGRLVVIAGDPALSATRSLLQVALTSPDPACCVLRLPPGASLPPQHPAYGKSSPAGEAVAYVCRAGVCLPPIADPRALHDVLA